jgi:hypothetical protein
MPLTREQERERSRKRRAEGTAHQAKANEFAVVPTEPLDLTTVDVLQRVHDLAARGVPESLIARACGCTLAAFRKAAAAHECLREALETGGAALEHQLVDNLTRIALDPEHPQCVISTFFLLKTKRGFNDRPDKASGRAPLVQINLPQSQSMESYLASLPSAHPDKPT